MSGIQVRFISFIPIESIAYPRMSLCHCSKTPKISHCNWQQWNESGIMSPAVGTRFISVFIPIMILCIFTVSSLMFDICNIAAMYFKFISCYTVEWWFQTKCIISWQHFRWVVWLFTEYDVAWGILKFQCKTWEFRGTSYSLNSKAICDRLWHFEPYGAKNRKFCFPHFHVYKCLHSRFPEAQWIGDYSEKKQNSHQPDFPSSLPLIGINSIQVG